MSNKFLKPRLEHRLEHVVKNIKKGAQLAEMRKKRGISQKWVAAEMGIHATRLCDLEKGKRPWLPWYVSSFLKAIGEQTVKPNIKVEQKGKNNHGS